MQYNNNPEERIMWEILANREYICEVEDGDPTTVPHAAARDTKVKPWRHGDVGTQQYIL